MARTRFTAAVVALAGVLHAGLGAWAFFAPRSFYQHVATFPPYNLHLLHDVGAFLLGIGAGLLAALAWRDAMFVVLLGVTVASGFHWVSHLLDRDLGGQATDPWLLGIWLLVVAAALLARAPARPGPAPQDKGGTR